ncbi:arsenite efflux transporter metallochaperone ArsD [Rubinisphaera italica]|uniref:Arsenical resistance operon trans-acting repressor ArsD n=1 Tax=Rubinisphaera italica TaxID=2527969 RepID=A0A5C5XE28_9PLAN|nr:arsenite efflux transporter metallochaperone ArsD [Rubinisphaera italica]TWT60651.1 Arsenical resistance operon trans-acting repressor ArsD [Rubinisphaera italica]HBN76144.1 arsenical resistance operon transcriptional repressor ArsD [Planctomycetaceae bacterium]
MSTVQIYDKAMCCSTGICGPQIDPVLPRFASDLEWLKSKGHSVERFNLGQQPAEYANNPIVKQMLQSAGVDCLPLVLVDGRVMSRNEYPSRENLALWTGASLGESILPVVSENNGDCCGSSDCC